MKAGRAKGILYGALRCGLYRDSHHNLSRSPFLYYNTALDKAVFYYFRKICVCAVWAPLRRVNKKKMKKE